MRKNVTDIKAANFFTTQHFHSKKFNEIKFNFLINSKRELFARALKVFVEECFIYEAISIHIPDIPQQHKALSQKKNSNYLTYNKTFFTFIEILLNEIFS